MLRGVWQALNSLSTHVAFTAIVPGATQTRKKCALDWVRWSSASLQTAVQKAILARSYGYSTKQVSWSRVNTVRRSSRLQLSTVDIGVHGTVSCRTALTRRHWTFYVCTLTHWCANASAFLCVDALYKLACTYLLSWRSQMPAPAERLKATTYWRDSREVAK